MISGLRLVKDGHVPYVTAYEQLPEEMKLVGQEALFFHVETIPSHRSVHKEAQGLLLFLQLPAFPPVSQQTLLHPAPLCLRYLTDANLPGNTLTCRTQLVPQTDQLHRWVCVLMERADMADESCHTVDLASQPDLPAYDLQAAALLIVTMKVLFGLDDQTEWYLTRLNWIYQTRLVPRMTQRLWFCSTELFSFRKWYRLVQAALTRAQQRRNQDIARKQWKGKNVFFTNKRDKHFAIKKRRISESIQMCFKRLSSQPAAVQDAGPSSFLFCWGGEDGSNGSDGPGLHHLKLDGVVSLNRGFVTPWNFKYWHPPLRPCNPRTCSSHYGELEPTLPRSFVWLLQLFAFMLDVEAWRLFDAVLEVERRVFGVKSPQSGQQIEIEENAGKWRRRRTRTEKQTRTQS
ncbi:TATA box-binding protein-associated factor RNA polymerase I subunit B-like [Fundulus heteroclitus]|uniref:TATA box-binding protein-associated factor RNA polymerase I subunit B-like n=1 Tax=Fundulus heteroclitus TaxID=8078 RepID=UPI00165B4F51|nr:TATA box-binding protein-associated factor RNA polymerase I subunit B-like [Fundulus heteroclitus]